THAFEEGGTGTISLRATQPTQDEVEIAYSDDGVGIPKQHLPRIFEPFFTTKRGAGGSGLGLHVVFNLVTQTLGGSIRALSQDGAGASFVVRFPKTPEIESAKPALTWEV